MPPLMKNKSFVKAGDPVLATYSFADIVQGTGYISLYGCQTGASTWALTTNSGVGSYRIYTTASSTTPFPEADFDITFGRALVIKGTMIASIPIKMDTGNSRKLTATVTVYHVTGATETQLGTATQDSITATATTVVTEYMCLQMTLTEKAFTIGDILRISVTVTCSDAGGADYIGHDPLNRTYSVSGPANNRMTFFVPTEINE